MRQCPRAMRTLLFSLLTLFVPVCGSGQANKSVVVVGVADAITGAPLTNARVQISDLRRVARTDWIGEARVADVPSGEHRIEVRQLGYEPADAPLLVRGDSIGVVFRLLRSAQSIDTVRINGAVIPSYLEEFERRRRSGLGRYLTSPQLDSIPTESLADFAARRFTGLRAEWDISHTSVNLSSTRGPTSFTQVCKPQIYIDGYFRDRAEEDLGSLAAGDVAGVEYYTVAPPVQYSRSGPGCGTILIWTRRW
jgi:hypothetical protein